MNESNSTEDSWLGNTPTCKRIILSFHILISGLILICIIGNAVSFYIWKRIGRHHGFSSSIILLMALAVSDTVLNMLILFHQTAPKLLLLYLDIDEYSYYLDVVLPYMFAYVWTFGAIALFATTWITVFLCIHRFAALQFPFADKTKKLTSFSSSMVQVFGIVVVGTVYFTPQFFMYDIKVRSYKNETYVDLKPTGLVYNEAYMTYNAYSFLLFMLLIPMVISSILTCKIIQLLMKAKAARANMVSTAGNSNMERGISVALVSVVIIFIVCAIPNAIHAFLVVAYPDSHDSCGGKFFLISNIIQLAMTLNSSINIFVYGACSSQFRKELFKWLKMCCCCCKPRAHSLHSSTRTCMATSSSTVSTQASDFGNTHIW